MKNNRFLIIIIILLILGFIFSSYLGPVRNIVEEITNPFSKFFTSSTTKIGGFFSTIGKISDLAKDNNDLKEQNLRLGSELASFKEVSHENEILKNYIKDLEFQIQILQNANDIENKNINGLKNIVDATIERTLR